MEYKITGISYDLLAKSMNVSIQGREDNKFGGIHANFPLELPDKLSSAELKEFLIKHVREQLAAAVEFKD